MNIKIIYIILKKMDLIKLTTGANMGNYSIATYQQNNKIKTYKVNGVCDVRNLFYKLEKRIDFGSRIKIEIYEGQSKKTYFRSNKTKTIIAFNNFGLKWQRIRVFTYSNMPAFFYTTN